MEAPIRLITFAQEVEKQTAVCAAKEEGEASAAEQLEALKETLRSESTERARLSMSRENLEADVEALRASLQQLSRELAYRRSSAPGDAPQQGAASSEVSNVLYTRRTQLTILLSEGKRGQ